MRIPSSCPSDYHCEVMTDDTYGQCLPKCNASSECSGAVVAVVVAVAELRKVVDFTQPNGWLSDRWS